MAAKLTTSAARLRNKELMAAVRYAPIPQFIPGLTLFHASLSPRVFLLCNIQHICFCFIPAVLHRLALYLLYGFWRALWFIIAMSVHILHICWLFWRSNFSHSNVDYFSIIELTVTRIQLERTRSIHEVVQNISSFMAGYLNITTRVSNFRWELKQKTRVK